MIQKSYYDYDNNYSKVKVDKRFIDLIADEFSGF